MLMLSQDFIPLHEAFLLQEGELELADSPVSALCLH